MGVHLIEKTQTNEKVKSLLNIVTAAVVGVMFNFLIYLGEAVILVNTESNLLQFINVSWIALSVIAMHRFKVNMILWLGVSCVFGLVMFFVK